MSETNTTTAPAPITADAVNALPAGSAERAAAAAALYRQGQGDPPTQTQVPTRPDNVPEKFWDAAKGTVNTEALLASYGELEKKQGAPKDPADPAATDDTKPKLEIPTDATDSAKVDAVVTAAGLDPIKLGEKIARTGNLEESDYAAIEKLGIPRTLIEAHVNMSKDLVALQQEKNTATAYEMVGGKDRATTIMAWAAESLSAEDTAAFNKKLAGSDWKDAITVLEARYTKANPATREPNLSAGNGRPGGSVSGYNSTAERTADMAKPEYRTDPAFRAQVRARMAVSTYPMDSHR